MENQVTCSESLDKSKILDSSEANSTNESQDFHLVDMSEDESLDKSQQDIESTKQDEAAPSVPSDSTETILNEIKITGHTMTIDIQNNELVKVEDAQNNEFMKDKDAQNTESSKKIEEGKEINENSKLQGKDKYSDEDEEIIQCTPPEVSSPSKKQSGCSVITSLKRKAGSFDEPPAKILRMASKEDISVSEKREQEGEESCHSFKSDDSQPEFAKNCSDTNVIIAETQDVGENENIEATLEIPTKHEEKTKDERHLELEMKEYKIDKNKNFNDTKLNQTVTKKEDNEDMSDSKSVTESNECRAAQVQIKEKDSTPLLKAVVAENIKLDLSNKSTDSTRPIEVKDNKMMYSEISEDKENGIEPKEHMSLEQNNSDVQEMPISTEATESYSNMYSGNICKSRKSIELIYDQTAVLEVRTKSSKELVEIDEDGEKIVLDSSQEDSDVKIENKNVLDNTKSDTIYKSCYDSKSSSEFSYKSIESTKELSTDSTKSGSKLVNGSSESKRCDTDSTSSLKSDTFSDMPVLDKADNNISTSVHNINKQVKPISVSKHSDHADLLSVSDNEPDVFIVDDKGKSNSTHSSSLSKALQMEKEIGIYVRMKCSLHIDEGTKEFLSKEITGVQCESLTTEPALMRQKNNDTSASLADISGNDNKDVSPGSVNSNPQLYQLNPSRLSFASTISSLSSVSSAASLAAKLAIRDNTHFSLPRVPAKHAKRHAQDIHLLNDKQAIDEAYERLSKEWQNSHLLTTTVLSFANTELTGIDTYNVSNERIDDQLQKIRSSTPEVSQEAVQQVTPKSTKKSKAVKRPRSKNTKSDSQSNGLNKISKVLSPTEGNTTQNRKKNKTEQMDNISSTIDISTKPQPHMITDELIGKDVFAKWSDNNYYPGTVADKIKTKYKINFYDGKSKVLIEDFVIPIPKILKEGLSVYAATKNYDYGSCGIIIDSETVNNEVYYTVETDEGEKLRVQIKDISLSADQAQVLKEEINLENKNLPSTPKQLAQITLDNMVDGKRRSKRIATPIFSTPKSKLIQTPTNKSEVEPSVSGVTYTIKKEKKVSSENDCVSSDSNVSIKDEVFSIGVQPEIIGTPYEQIVKGPQNRIKSKSRSKKKVDDEETIAMFGPIPPADSNIFKGMSFILTYASVETIDRFQIDNKDSSSDPGTENEEEWVKKPFIRDRLNKQIVAGGGKIYTDFSEIPQDEYKNTKLITNVPNTTAKTLLCLSVGIPAYNHNWIIRCCQEGKLVNPAENELPAGWSLDKKTYVEMFERTNNKPLTQVVVIIPAVDSEKQFASFWRQICENAGAVVLLAEKPDVMENFVEGTVVVTNSLCPSWAVEKANKLQIPLLSTTWIIQCLIEGKYCLYDANPRYKYNHKQN